MAGGTSTVLRRNYVGSERPEQRPEGKSERPVEHLLVAAVGTGRAEAALLRPRCGGGTAGRPRKPQGSQRRPQGGRGGTPRLWAATRSVCARPGEGRAAAARRGRARTVAVAAGDRRGPWRALSPRVAVAAVRGSARSRTGAGCAQRGAGGGQQAAGSFVFGRRPGLDHDHEHECCRVFVWRFRGRKALRLKIIFLTPSFPRVHLR